MNDAVVGARVDPGTKEEAERVLGEMGLSVADAIRLLLVHVAAEKTLPFDVESPNAETIAAMEEARHGELRSFDSVEDLLAELNEAD